MENRFRRNEGNDQLELFPTEEKQPKWLFPACVLGLLALAVLMFSSASAPAQEQPEGEGYWGVGHGRYHQLYKKMHNQNGTHCCSDGDCSPTRGRTMADGSFEVMVNGRWTKVGASQKVVDAYGLDENWHVCFDRNSLWVFCVIPQNTGF